MSAKTTAAPIAWATGDGSEEAALLESVPDSRRLRQILKDLEAIVHQEGFLHLTMNDIAARLRCSHVTLYRLAEGRSELFERLVELYLARARDSGRRRFSDASTWPDRLIGYLSAGAEAARDTSFTFLRDLQNFPGGRRALLVHQERRVADLETIVTQGVKAGAFNKVNSAVAADILFVSMRRFIEPEFLAKVGLTMGEAMDEVYKLIEFGIIRTAASDETRAARNRRRAQTKRD